MQSFHSKTRMPVRTGFNTASGMDCMQYRPSQPLGQLNPEVGFLNGALFWTNRRNLAGFFLSPKSAENVRKPCDTKETFVHGKNLKLMAFFPKSFPSL